MCLCACKYVCVDMYVYVWVCDNIWWSQKIFKESLFKEIEIKK